MSFAMFDASPYGAVLADAEGRVTDANPAATRVLGTSRAALLGQDVRTLAAQARARGTVEVTVAPLAGEAGTILHLRDAAPEHAVAARLAQREAVAAAVWDAVVETDAEFRIVQWNRGAEQLYGWRAAEVVGRRIPEVLQTTLADSERARMLDDLDAQGHVLTLATQRTASGAAIEVEASVISLRDEHGTVTGYVSVNRDVSLRHRLEARLQETRHLEIVGRLAGGIAHDLNTLLTAILGYAGLSLGDRSLPPHIRPDLEQIIGAAERAGTLTRQLLAFSRTQQLSPAALDLNRLLAGTAAARRRLVGRDVELVDRPAADLDTVTVDPTQLERALLDVVANAGEAMPDGGRLTLETANVDLEEAAGEVAPGRYVRLRVSDTGAGMDEATRPRAFEPFFTTKRGHTGLGLSSVHGIVYQSGGHVTLDSAPGAGTTVTILLPGSASGQEGPAAARSSAARSASGSGVGENRPSAST